MDFDLVKSILVSFSLYGKDPKYSFGAIENAKTIARLGRDWHSVFYCGVDVGSNVLDALRSHGAIVVVVNNEKSHPNGMFWRFRAFNEFNYDYALSRDADSRITSRELAAIKDWIGSKKDFHIMRDHPNHNAEILGGMFGLTPRFKYLFNEQHGAGFFGEAWGEDQRFLKRLVYPRIRHSVHIHDSFFIFERNRHSFPTKRELGEYVGESIDANGSYSQVLRHQVIKFEKNILLRMYLRLRTYCANIYLKCF